MTAAANSSSNPDTQYRNLLQSILDHGVRPEQSKRDVKVGHQVGAITLMAPQPLKFNLNEGFPLITERRISEKMWKGAIGELIGFINGARTHEQLTEYGCNWWKAWVTEKKCKKRGLETGDLGPGSYGAAFHDFPTAQGDTYNQFQNIIEQIEELPHLRTHFISPWIPQYTIRGEGKQQKVVVCPCHGWIHIRILNGQLTMHMFQRSSDTPIGLPANLAQYGALTLMLSEVTGYPVREYIHSFSDAHIYADQEEHVRELLKREPRPLPKMILKNKRKNLFAYRPDDFEIVDYDPHPGVWDIPVAV